MRTGSRLATLLPVTLCFLAACAEEAPQGYWEERPSTPGTQATGANPHAGMGATNPGAPGAAGALVGKVVDLRDVPSYTYVKLEMPNGEFEWAAVPSTTVEVGRHVAISNPIVMQNFKTTTDLGVMEKVVFGSDLAVLDPATGAHVASGGADVSDPHAGAGMGTNPHGAVGGPALEVQPGELQRPEGALAIADVFARAQELQGTPVTVHGKVIKATPLRGGVWTHVQDGSGDATKGTHDLTVVLGTTPEVGAVITIRGTLQIGHEMAMGSAAQQPVLNTATIQGE